MHIVGGRGRKKEGEKGKKRKERKKRVDAGVSFRIHPGKAIEKERGHLKTERRTDANPHHSLLVESSVLHTVCCTHLYDQDPSTEEVKSRTIVYCLISNELQVKKQRGQQPAFTSWVP
jgi:hypothetical protein